MIRSKNGAKSDGIDLTYQFNIVCEMMRATLQLVFIALVAHAAGDDSTSELVLTEDAVEDYASSIIQKAFSWKQDFQSQIRSFIKTAGGGIIDIDDLTSKCFEQFGCFSIGEKWTNDFLRPVSVFPLAPDVINPHFCLYTRRNPFECEKLIIGDPSSLYRTSFNPRGQVYFIIHGFLESGERPWIKEMTKELLKRSSANVIVIDWAGGSNPPYTQAVANIRLVGVMSAHLINMMVKEDLGLRSERIHVIGHSLGAHMASYIGTALKKHFNMRLGRISGLDPAEPHFAKTDIMVRLDPSDAIFVDNIHTDAAGFIRWGLGLREAVGHVDFYPNGGRDQPGCTDSFQGHVIREQGSFLNGMRRWLNCDHIKSHQYFIATINKKVSTLAAECTSWEHYLNGTCFSCEPDTPENPVCAQMGFHSINAFVPASTRKRSATVDIMLKESPKRKRDLKMYLITGEHEPFYKNQYRVTLKVSEETRESGQFEINIQGDDGETGFLPLDYKLKYFEFGSVQTVVVAGDPVGNMKGATVRWSHQTSPINPFSWRFSIPSVSVDVITVQTLGESLRVNLCATKKLPSGSAVPFTICTSK